MGKRPPVFILTPTTFMFVVALSALIVNFELAFVLNLRSVPSLANAFILPRVFCLVDLLDIFDIADILLFFRFKLNVTLLKG